MGTRKFGRHAQKIQIRAHDRFLKSSFAFAVHTYRLLDDPGGARVGPCGKGEPAAEEGVEPAKCPVRLETSAASSAVTRPRGAPRSISELELTEWGVYMRLPGWEPVVPRVDGREVASTVGLPSAAGRVGTAAGPTAANSWLVNSWLRRWSDVLKKGGPWPSWSVRRMDVVAACSASEVPAGAGFRPLSVSWVPAVA